MKMRKCPYCGRRISYASSFASRRKAEYICQKCGKESKVAVDKKVILFFIVAVVISLAIMAGWILAGLVSNPLGILRQLHRASFTMSRTRNTVSLWRQKKQASLIPTIFLPRNLTRMKTILFRVSLLSRMIPMIILKLTRMYLTKSEPKEMPQDKDLIQMRFLPIRHPLKSRNMFPWLIIQVRIMRQAEQHSKKFTPKCPSTIRWTEADTT